MSRVDWLSWGGVTGLLCIFGGAHQPMTSVPLENFSVCLTGCGQRFCLDFNMFVLNNMWDRNSKGDGLTFLLLLRRQLTLPLKPSLCFCFIKLISDFCVKEIAAQDAVCFLRRSLRQC